MSRFWLSLALALAAPLVLWGCPPGDDDDDVANDDDDVADDDDDDVADDDDVVGDDDDAVSDEYGPENSWWHAQAADVPAGLTGTGWGSGDIANNFTIVDQFGDEVELYQFYGQVIVLDVFAYW